MKANLMGFYAKKWDTLRLDAMRDFTENALSCVLIHYKPTKHQKTLNCFLQNFVYLSSQTKQTLVLPSKVLQFAWDVLVQNLP